MNLKQAIEDAKPIALPFLVGLIIYTLLGSGIFFWFGKLEAHQFLNAYHTPYLDVFFQYLTHLGHGFVPALAAMFLLSVRYAWALALGASSALMGLIVQFLKRSVFEQDHRPAMFFQEGGLTTIEGVNLMLHHSFPSGHSATALCIFLMLAFFVKQKWATYMFVLLALLTAFSRVYISQHFIQDTIVGGWIGFVLAYLGYVFIVHYAETNTNSKLNKRFWPS